MTSQAWLLPATWAWADFPSVAMIAQNLVAPEEVPDLPHIAPNHIKPITGELFEYKSVKEDEVISNKQRFFPGQIVFSKIRPYLRKSALVDFDGVCSADMYPLWPTEAIDRKFLLRWLLSEDFRDAALAHQGRTLLPKINQKGLNSTQVPLPPLPEQRRIVAKLDRLSARTKAARAHLARVQSLATRAKQATLAAAFRGELTEDWRDRMKVKDGPAFSVATLDLDASERGTWSSEELPPTWEWRKFRESFIDLTDSRRKLPTNKYAEEGEFVVVDQGAKLFGGRSNARDLVHTADPPVIIFGDHTRCVKYVDRAFIQGADGVKVLKTASGVNLRFAFWALNAVELPDKGYSRHMKFLKATVFPIPPLEEQAEIVGRIEAAFARIDRMVEDATRAAHLLDRLDQRLLAKAFRGELVPQDPNDEPATDLLARIKAARVAAPRKRGRRQRA